MGTKKISKIIDMVVENVVNSIDKKLVLEESVKFLGKEIIKLDNDDFSASIKQLKSELEKKVPEFLTLNHGSNEMDNPTRKLIAHTINKTVGMDSEKREILIRAITDYDEMQKKNTDNE